MVFLTSDPRPSQRLKRNLPPSAVACFQRRHNLPAFTGVHYRHIFILCQYQSKRSWRAITRVRIYATNAAQRLVYARRPFLQKHGYTFYQRRNTFADLANNKCKNTAATPFWNPHSTARYADTYHPLDNSLPENCKKKNALAISPVAATLFARYTNKRFPLVYL